MLSEDVHWVQINSRLVLYNVPLVLDGLQNFNQPHLHEKAIAVYPSSILLEDKNKTLSAESVFH
jgi:hypothetical protein